MASILLLTLLALFAAEEPVAEPAGLGPDDYAVLSVVARVYVGPAFGEPLVIQQETTTTTPAYRDPNPWIVRGAYRYNPALLDFQARNGTAQSLEANLNLEAKFEILPEPELKGLLNKASKSGFSSRFPQAGGYLCLSVPGYDARRQRAFVYAAYYCAGACTDGGKYFFLNKGKKDWSLERVVSAWWTKPDPPTQASRQFKPEAPRPTP